MLLLSKYYLCPPIPLRLASMRTYCLSAQHLRSTIRNIMSGVYRRIAATSSKVQNVNYATTNAHIFVFVQRVYVPCKDRIFEIYIEKFLGFFFCVCMCTEDYSKDDGMRREVKCMFTEHRHSTLLVNISAEIHSFIYFFFLN